VQQNKRLTAKEQMFALCMYVYGALLQMLNAVRRNASLKPDKQTDDSRSV
jgi:hypothetical protein